MLETVIKEKFNLQHCCLQQMQKYLPDRFSFEILKPCQRPLKAKEAFFFISVTLGNKPEYKTQYNFLNTGNFWTLYLYFKKKFYLLCISQILYNRTFTIEHLQVWQYVTNTKYIESIYSLF